MTRRPVRLGDRPLIVADLDGTLIDSSPVMVEAFRIAYARVGATGTPPIAEFLDQLGAPFPDILATLGLPQAMAPLFRAASSDRLAQIRLYPQAVDACVRAKREGMALALLTGKDRTRTLQILARFKLDGLFDLIGAGDDPGPGKPSPVPVLQLCNRLGLSPAQTVVVGDSVFDITAGRSAGAATIGCLWGLGREDDLRAAGPSGVVAAPNDLYSALASWRASLPRSPEWELLTVAPSTADWSDQRSAGVPIATGQGSHR
jgi:AHBA synthesis associated protein